METGKVIAMSDFNGQVGVPRIADNNGGYYKYRGVKDDFINSHGRMLMNINHSNAMVVANHLYHNGRQLLP